MAFKGPQPSTDVETRQADGDVKELDPKLLAQFAEMAVAIPAADGDGTEDILRQIMAATNWEQLNDPWNASKVDDILGKVLDVVSVTRRPSSFRGGLGIMLVVKLIDPRTKTEYVKATGSIATVGQFAWLHFMGASAVKIRWHRAERQSQAGFYPQHIEIVDAHIPPRASA